MQIKKVSDKIELNVSAQGCGNDCTYYKYYSALYHVVNWKRKVPKCKKVTDARWTKWW